MLPVAFPILGSVSLALLVATQDKAAIRDELFALDQQYVSARTLGLRQTQLAPLLRRRAELVARLGGGDPALAARAAAIGPRPAASVPSGPRPTSRSTPRSVTTLPPGANGATLSFARTPNLPILDAATAVDSVVVSGAGAYLWDVDLYVDISHTWCGDLDVHLVAPSGKRVTIVTDVAEGLVDVFRGTLFDDSPDAPAWSYAHSSGFASSPLNPEGALHWLAGEDPNGTWRLEIFDDAYGDVGVLHGWRLDVTTLNAPPAPASSPALFVSLPGIPIPDFVPVSDPIAVSGLDDFIAEVRVRVDFTHTWNSDVRFDLVGPSGRRARLSTFNGGALDNVFAGTNFFDVMGRVAPTPNPLQDQPIDSYPFANNVAALQGQPEGALTSFLGDDPNGTWRLELLDTVGGDTGVLRGWGLSISTYPTPPPSPTPYCAPLGPTAIGCQPTISATSNPNLSHSNVCVISVANVDGQRSGIFFYGANGPTLKSWCAGGAGLSKLCVEAPTQRAGSQNSLGTLDQCDGTLTLDWNDWQIDHPGAIGAPWLVGSQAHVQGWFRSPTDCKTTFLTEALELTYLP